MELDRPLPQPITPEARPFWEGLRQHRLMLPRCDDCGRAFFYPRVACPRCHSRRVGWTQASGRGTLYSFEIAYQSFNRAFRVKPPFVLAMIELAEGPRMLSNLVDVEPEPRHIHCGMPVEIVYHTLTDEITLPLFRPAGSAGGSAR